VSESCLVEKDLGMLVDSPLNMSRVPRWPRRPTASWLVSGIVWPARVGGDCAPVLGTGEAAPGVLCSVLGPSLQDRHGVAGACPEKGNEAGAGSREQVVLGSARRGLIFTRNQEGTELSGLTQPGQTQQGIPYHVSSCWVLVGGS